MWFIVKYQAADMQLCVFMHAQGANPEHLHNIIQALCVLYGDAATTSYSLSESCHREGITEGATTFSDDTLLGNWAIDFLNSLSV